ncbi:hypothetical protein NQZ68_032984 [Dissostichus eleginoides]|nr:hypothetical protein NQZ68_032984 [Dissostichus eleginoides]
MAPTYLVQMARARPSCLTEAAKLSGHVRTVSYEAKIKETGPVLFTPPGSFVLDLTHPGTAGFPKAGVQNQDPPPVLPVPGGLHNRLSYPSIRPHSSEGKLAEKSDTGSLQDSSLMQALERRTGKG